MLIQTRDNTFQELLRALALVLDLEENRKLYHAWRVAALTDLMLDNIGWKDKRDIHYAALLHDIGAIGLSDHIVHHPSLSEQLANPHILNHPVMGARIISAVPCLKGAVGYVLDHHEWWNGNGYPHGKQGEQISIGAQFIRIADSFDVILQNNQGQISRAEILRKLQKGVGKEFSPFAYQTLEAVLHTTDTYERLLNSETLLEILKAEEALCKWTPGENNEANLDTVVAVFAKVIDAKHAYTAGHSLRVGHYATQIAAQMGLANSEIKKAFIAGQLHDAGKVAVPVAILDKPARLTMDELKIIKNHPVLSAEILGGIAGMAGILPAVAHHHERYDGKGYPAQLTGEEIPLLARIIAVADAFDAMTSTRPYQATRSFPEAMDLLKRNAGTQFDPVVVETAVQSLREVEVNS